VWICCHPVAMPPRWLPSDDLVEIRSTLIDLHHVSVKTRWILLKMNCDLILRACVSDSANSRAMQRTTRLADSFCQFLHMLQCVKNNACMARHTDPCMHALLYSTVECCMHVSIHCPLFWLSRSTFCTARAVRWLTRRRSTCRPGGEALLGPAAREARRMAAEATGDRRSTALYGGGSSRRRALLGVPVD
jgi:hypothetical protein